MFNEIIVKNFSNPEHAGIIDDPSKVIEIGNPVCGDRIKIMLGEIGDQIVDAKYQAWGCATSLATGNVFCSMIKGKTYGELQHMDTNDIDCSLGSLDPSQMHCLEMLRLLFHDLLKSKGVMRVMPQEEDA